MLYCEQNLEMVYIISYTPEETVKNKQVPVYIHQI